MRILGISAFYHDSAAALIDGPRIVAAAQQERFSRIKHDAGFPRDAIAYCLAEAGIRLDEVDHVAFFEKPFVKFERLLETYLANAPRGFTSFRRAMPIWVKDKLFQKRNLVRDLAAMSGSDPEAITARMLFAEHHQSHAASSFFPSPFDEAVVLTLDGVGEWTTTALAVGRGNALETIRELRWPHSLGLLYSAFTYYTGFRVNSGEYKLMGLAPYGEPRYAGLIIDNLIDIKPDGSFRLDQRYFEYATGLTMTNARFNRLFGGPPRTPEEPITQRHMDLAASVQQVTEEVICRLARDAAASTGIANLCLAGGVALNCVANGRIAREGHFRNIWVQPAAGDAGGAIGAALAAYHQHCGQPREAGDVDAMRGGFLGPDYTQAEIERQLKAAGGRYSVHHDDELIARTAEALDAGKCVGWFNGRMEFGPRALGGRSILADPRNPGMQRKLNLKVKFRESFRPFAPSVLAEDVADYFEHDGESPYMLMVAPVCQERRRDMSEKERELFGIEKLNVPRSDIPAVTHVDYSARVQTVHAETNPRYHALLSAFKQRTGCPVLVNTSFNVRGEPIVCSPQDAFRCFMGTDLDVLVAGNCMLAKPDQDPALADDYRDRFAHD